MEILWIITGTNTVLLLYLMGKVGYLDKKFTIRTDALLEGVKGAGDMISRFIKAIKES